MRAKTLLTAPRAVQGTLVVVCDEPRPSSCPGQAGTPAWLLSAGPTSCEGGCSVLEQSKGLAAFC